MTEDKFMASCQEKTIIMNVHSFDHTTHKKKQDKYGVQTVHSGLNLDQGDWYLDNRSNTSRIKRSHLIMMMNMCVTHKDKEKVSFKIDLCNYFDWYFPVSFT